MAWLAEAQAGKSLLRHSCIELGRAGSPHSPMNCTPWGTPQRTARGPRLRRASPSSGTISSICLFARGLSLSSHETNLNPDSYLQQKSDLTGVVETEYILSIRAGANGNGND